MFLALAASIFREFSVLCFAWALMGNHYHLLIRPTRTRCGVVLHRLNMKYAQYFNEKYGRVGHLFQNRFWDRLSESDAAMVIRVIYIHLNPLRSGIVPDLDALERYPWTGHAALMGNAPVLFLNDRETLGYFGDDAVTARRELRVRLAEAARPIDMGVRTLDEALTEACRASGLLPSEVLAKGRAPDVLPVRSLAARLALSQAGLSTPEVARGLGMSRKTVRQIAVRVRPGADR